MKKRDKSFLTLLFFKSVLMGTVNKLPGISGGLVALITGFYIEMINSLKKLDFNVIKLLFSLNFKKINKDYNGKFLLIIFLGIVVSYFTTSQILDIFFQSYELHVWSVFFGMILASNLILILNNKKWDFQSMIMIGIGLLTGLLLSISEPISENRNLFFIFFCGLISVCGMIIPGLSGSFLLIILGNFKLLLVDSVNSLYNSILIIFGIRSDIYHDVELLKIVLVFTLGSISGLVLLSSILSFLITNFEKTINQLIIGFVFGSLFIVWPWNYSINNFDFSYQNLLLLLWILLGFFIVLIFNRYAKTN